MNKKFVLIDLISQREAVRKVIQNLSVEEKITWLSKHGMVSKLEMPKNYKQVYCFESTLNLEACFFFDDNNKLVFIGDHTTFY